MNGNLQRALKKVKYLNDGEWVGYLTPSEIVALIEAGAKIKDSNSWVVDMSRENINKGISTPGWFYFYPGKLTVRVDRKDKRLTK